MKYLTLAFILLFGGCSLKEFEHNSSKIIIIKSPKLKFADIGYIRNTDTNIELELFMAGKAIENISINNFICVRDGCMSKSAFNAKYLNENYPSELLQNILLGMAIYEGEKKVKTADGFTQKINTRHVGIIYKVNSDTIYFKDKKNNILFKIKDTN